MAVLSSCPCNRDVNYVVTTEGHVTYWHKYKPQVQMTKIMDQVDICRFNLTYVHKLHNVIKNRSFFWSQFQKRHLR